MTLPKLILGSTSPFRAELLKKLRIPFDTAAPDVDESPKPGETPADLVTRLTRLKAQTVAHQHPEHLIITSDQVATFNGLPIGKPHDYDKAVNQLSNFSGKRVTFLTGIGLLNTLTGHYQFSLEPFHVYFKVLSRQQIEAYLLLEEPYQCAGSFKSEGLGITLFKKLEGDDPNTLVGLPLIRLTEFLANEKMILPLVTKPV
ncbi:unnamed protein product [Cyprideis torosa]|uniref:Uncharacterized protein n=1 Tax=Cyprideis torosa TaxID=163714 RepID=A0A7R8WW03_9CRUS|nr:unnamed protein product [Cyprideis torosa]CAG0907935.1 unnamed protein product [Cyprideis torosa]